MGVRQGDGITNPELGPLGLGRLWRAEDQEIQDPWALAWAGDGLWKVDFVAIRSGLHRTRHRLQGQDTEDWSGPDRTGPDWSGPGWAGLWTRTWVDVITLSRYLAHLKKFS